MADISKITLPSGNTYDIKDAVARAAIAGGVSFIIAWDGTSTPVVADIPAGVVVKYNNVDYTGTLSADDAVVGAFYLIKSATQIGLDVYDEYVPVGTTPKSWEKIGDTQLNLTDVVTNVTLNKQTDTVIGSDATFTITQPTVALSTGATAGDGVISVATGITSTSATGDSVAALTGLGTPNTSTVLTGAKPKENTTSVTNSIQYLKSQGTATTTKISAAASGGAVSASGDNVTVLTGLGTPSTSNVASSVTPTTKKLATTTITGVSGSTNITPVESRTSQTTATGGWTAVTASSTDGNSNGNPDVNENLLANISVSNETLTIGAATLNTQTTYSAGAPRASLAVPTAASSATRVATGAVATTDTSGADIVTDVAVGDTVAAVTGYASPTTDTVIGTASTFSVTNPTITISSGSSGDVTVATGIGAATTRYLSIESDGTATAVTGYPNPTTDTVLGEQTAITVTPTTTNIKATATGANTAWNNKDQVTVLTNATDVSVTKGNS